MVFKLQMKIAYKLQAKASDTTEAKSVMSKSDNGNLTKVNRVIQC